MALRWLKALEQGFDVKLTAGTHGGCLRLLSAVNGDVHTLEDLKGKTIGVTDMASPDRNFFSILLKKTRHRSGARCAVAAVPGRSAGHGAGAWRSAGGQRQ